MNDHDSAEYSIMNQRLIHMETLKHQIINSYFALATPMAAVLFFSHFNTLSRVIISVVGFILSLIWISMAIRQNAYTRRYVTRMLEIEGGNPGYMAREIEWMHCHPSLRWLPGLSRMLVSLFTIGALYFFATFLLIFIDWHGLEKIVETTFELLFKLWHSIQENFDHSLH